MLRLLLLVLAIGVGGSFYAATAKNRNDKILNRQYADLKRFHFGFSIGMHLQDLNFTHNGYITPDGQQWNVEVPAYSPGFCVNVLGDLKLHNNFNLRLSPGIWFGNKTLTMRDFNSGTTQTQDIKSTYVVVPIDLKISGARYLNSRPYVTAGVMPAFDVGKRRSEPVWLKQADTYLTLGLGCDFYLPFFKLNPEVKFCFGLGNILRKDRPDLDDDPEMMKITQSLDKAKSNMIVFTFYFE